jgi:hypothetical protein
MDREEKRATLIGGLTQDADHVAGLSQIKAIEGLIHDEQRLRREETEGDQEPASIPFGQIANTRLHHWVEPQRLDRAREPLVCVAEQPGK